VTTADVLPAYLDRIAGDIDLGGEKITVVLDAGNGTAGPVAGPLFERLGCEVVPLFFEPDGNFPNHHPDPTVETNLAPLIAKVAETGATVGIGFDGDSDRIGVVDDQGSVIWGDKLMIIFSRAILQEVPGATFVSEVKCSKTMYEDIEKNGGRAIMWKTGHSLIKSKMKEEQAELAGEMSGHIFFGHRYFGFDDAVYAGARLLEILAKTGKTPSELLADVPKTYYTPEIRTDCPDELKAPVVERLKQSMKDQGYDVIDVDGARVRFPDGWGLVRASNTGPILVLRFEADSEARLEEIRALIEGELEKAKNA